ncbi:relaxase/mobilization nuclease domain-containing protein [Vibrio parahaemolyticus]|nr:relaxase/mobilization nuclease domain-containing protein [Vibrio parahaemolyticus]
MIVKFTRNGRGRGSGPIDYLLGKNRDRDLARVLQGNAEQVKELIDLSPYRKKYTSGFLSFAEPNLEEETKAQLIAEFEDALLPGMEKDQYSILWVEHLDKGRLELNFVIPNIELQTGKRLQPYYHRADNPRIDAWRTIKNIELGLHDPDDPNNRQLLSWKYTIPKDAAAAREQITQILSAQVVQGNISSRDDVIKWLKSNGIEIARATKSNISIKNPNPDAKRNIRLTGAIYEQTFAVTRQLREELSRASHEYRDSAETRLSEARERYQRCFDRKREFHIERYRVPEAASTEIALHAISKDEGNNREFPVERSRRIRRKSLEDKRRDFAQSSERAEQETKCASSEKLDNRAFRSSADHSDIGSDERELYEPDNGQTSRLGQPGGSDNDRERTDLPGAVRKLFASTQRRNQKQSGSLDSASEELINDRVRDTPFKSLGSFAGRALRAIRAVTKTIRDLDLSIGRLRETKQAAVESMRATSSGTEANQIRISSCTNELEQLNQACERLDESTRYVVTLKRPPNLNM